MSALDNLLFESGFSLPVPGLPLQGWQTKSAGRNDDLFIVSEDGHLYLQPKSTDLRFASDDASGTFLIYTTSHCGQAHHEYCLRFHNGVVVDLSQDGSAQGFNWEPVWTLDRSRTFPTVGDDVEEWIAIIRASNGHQDLEFSSDSIRVMVALALCRNEFLGTITPVMAWRMLSPAQVTAISTWWR